jgi:hypothetical protein
MRAERYIAGKKILMAKKTDADGDFKGPSRKVTIP